MTAWQGAAINKEGSSYPAGGGEGTSPGVTACTVGTTFLRTGGTGWERAALADFPISFPGLHLGKLTVIPSRISLASPRPRLLETQRIASSLTALYSSQLPKLQQVPCAVNNHVFHRHLIFTAGLFYRPFPQDESEVQKLSDLPEKWLGHKGRLGVHVGQQVGPFLLSSSAFFSPQALPCYLALSASSFEDWFLNSHWKKRQASNCFKPLFLHSCQHLVVRCPGQQLMLGCWEGGAETLYVPQHLCIVFELLSNTETYRNTGRLRRGWGVRGAV